MIYNTKIESEKKQAQIRFNYLINKGEIIELKVKRKSKTINQNSYLHLICGYFGVEAGYTMDYVKREFFKKLVNPDVFIIEKVSKSGLAYPDLLSWSQISKEIATACINKFIMWSSENGIVLPSPGEDEFIRHCENEIEKNKNYL